MIAAVVVVVEPVVAAAAAAAAVALNAAAPLSKLAPKLGRALSFRARARAHLISLASSRQPLR